jgi:hypothetical protein
MARESFRRRAWLALLAWWFLATPAARPADASPDALVWTAPSQCPDLARVRSRIEELSGTPQATWPAGFSVRAEATRAYQVDGGGGWRLSIEFSGPGGSGRRVIDGESCAAVAEAAALHIALGLEAAIEPGAAPVMAPAARAASGVDVAAWLGASALGDVGTLPAPAAGGAVRVAGYFGRVGTELRAAALLARRAALTQMPAAGGEIALYWAEPAVCVEPVRIVLRGCAGVQVGWITGRGSGVENGRREGALWVAPDASLSFGVPLTARLELEFRAMAAFPAVRPRFELESGALLHQPDRAVAQISVGAGWRIQ